MHLRRWDILRLPLTWPIHIGTDTNLDDLASPRIKEGMVWYGWRRGICGIAAADVGSMRHKDDRVGSVYLLTFQNIRSKSATNTHDSFKPAICPPPTTNMLDNHADGCIQIYQEKLLGEFLFLFQRIMLISISQHSIVVLKVFQHQHSILSLTVAVHFNYYTFLDIIHLYFDISGGRTIWSTTVII